MRVGRSPRKRSVRRSQRGISLVELLVAMAIMSIITAMLLVGWFALSKSYGFTLHSSDARDSGRQAMQRMQREIRDAQRPAVSYLGGGSSLAPDSIIYRAYPYWIAFSTTFNNLGNSTPASSGGASPTPVPSEPYLVVYRLYSADKELWRFEDVDGDGTITGVDVSEGATGTLAEQVNGEGRRLILTDVVNRSSADVAKHVPIFTYNLYDTAGNLDDVTQVTGADRYSIIAVQVRLLVDLNPAKAPVYADLRGTAQLRNARQ